MKLRALRLKDVRKFTAPVAIEGIGDGLNLFCEANEFGKSTMVEALHTLFFTKHTSWRQDRAASLVPHAGGDPYVAADIELDGVRFTVEKQFSAKPTRRFARILRAGTVLRQSDEAEAWLAERVRGPDAGGPSDLLWVRQGAPARVCGSDHARRDLLNRIAGEVGLVTGAQKLDAVQAILRTDLSDFETANGAVAKAGRLGKLRARVGELEGRRADLVARAETLRADVERRALLKARLAVLDDPDDALARRQRLGEATALLRAAEKHAGELSTATAQAEALASDAAMAGERLQTLTRTMKAAAVARAALDAAAVGAAAALAALKAADACAATSAATLAALRENHRAAAETLRAAMRQAREADVAARRGDLAHRLAAAEAARRDAEIAKAEARAAIAADAFARLAALEGEVDAAERARALGAPTLTMLYSGASTGVSVEGVPLDDGVAHPVPDGAEVCIAGIGTLTVRPGAGASGAAVAQARERLAAALLREGRATMVEARSSDRVRIGAEERRRDAEQRLKLCAPDGVARLREALAELGAPTALRENLPAPDEAERLERLARSALEAGEAAADAARSRADAGRFAQAAAEATRAGEARRLDDLARDLAPYPDPAAAREKMEAEAIARAASARAAAALRDGLAASAPDLPRLKAQHDRHSAVIAQAECERQSVREELRELAGRIASSAGDAVADDLATVDAELAVARDRRDAAEAEHQLLKLVAATLERARAQAVDRYLAPVLAEVAPLIAAVWPTATLCLDPATALPIALRRDFEESLDVLSGGTQEQLAILVRLAFARLLARAGVIMPVILDDAIVFTDDDRIEEIFAALHRVAGELQIVVLTCRERAFRELGGRRLSLSRPTMALAAE